jgi:hypothetical protein
MQLLLATISDLLLPYLLFLKFSHHLERLSDDLLIPSPLTGQALSSPAPASGIFDRGGEGGCLTVFPLYFREKEMQIQRHEVCFN